MKITASRRTYEVTNKDLVMYNGACYHCERKTPSFSYGDMSDKSQGVKD